MDSHVVLIQLVLILVSARIFGDLAAYLKTPAVIGELIAGVIIGPSVLGLIEFTPSIQLLAQIGIILFLFDVGLETNLGRLASSGVKASVVAIGGVVFPFILGFYLCYYVFSLSLLPCLYIASALTATSIGITLRILLDLKKQNAHESQIIIGAAVMDDIIGIIILAMIFEFSVSGTINILNAGKILGFIILFFIISPIAAKFASLSIKKWDEKSEIPGLLVTTVVSLILLFAWIAHQLGAPELLGGFAAGLALSRQFFFPFAAFLHQTPEFSEKVEEQMKPIVHLFAPIFFVSVGLSLNLKSISWDSNFIWILTASLLIIAIVGKLISGFLITKESLHTKLLIGTAMIPRGEVGLIFANVGLTAGVLQNDVYAAIIIVIALTTFMAPFVLKSLYKKAH